MNGMKVIATCDELDRFKERLKDSFGLDSYVIGIDEVGQREIYSLGSLMLTQSIIASGLEPRSKFKVYKLKYCKLNENTGIVPACPPIIMMSFPFLSIA